MNKFLAFLAIVVLTCCNTKTENKATEVKTQRNRISLDQARLAEYFDRYEVEPWIVVNNIEGNQTELSLSNHKIKWLNMDDDCKIKIDDHLFSLKNEATLNTVWDKSKDSIGFANNWDEMRLYKINGRELIGIKMSFQPCTGLGCSVNYFLIYDLQTKTKNFFGTFRTNNKLALCNFNNSYRVDYLSKTFNGDAQGSTPMEFIYELYSMENNGRFLQQKNSNGQTYEIKQITFPNDATRSDVFEQRWLTQIK